MTLLAAKVPGLDPNALKAVRDSLPGKLISRTAALMALVLLVLGFAETAQIRVINLGVTLSPPWLISALLIGVSSLVIALQLVNEWRMFLNRRHANQLAFTPAKVPQGYFRIGPYLEADRKLVSVQRADGAHHKVLDWLLTANAVPLYLTGDSGSGKSSLLNAFALPELKDQGWSIVAVRAAENPEAALVQALRPSRPRTSQVSLRELIEAAAQRSRSKLLLVLDQFEEFVILGSAERQAAFAAMLADLANRPIRGLKLLLVVRSDYQVALEELGLPRLRQGENFIQVGRFREGAARAFFERSDLGLTDATLARLLVSAADLDDSPGLTRPITLNVLGYILQETGGKAISSVDAGTLVRKYIAQSVGVPEIRDWAPPVLEALITENGTKRPPRTEDDLAAATKLRPAEVRAVLHSLANAALARPFEQSFWELSHDFIARAARSFLGRRRISLLRFAGAYAAPGVGALAILSCLTAYALYFNPNEATGKGEARLILQAQPGPMRATLTARSKVDLSSTRSRANVSIYINDEKEACNTSGDAYLNPKDPPQRLNMVVSCAVTIEPHKQYKFHAKQWNTEADAEGTILTATYRH